MQYNETQFYFNFGEVGCEILSTAPFVPQGCSTQWRVSWCWQETPSSWGRSFDLLLHCSLDSVGQSRLLSLDDFVSLCVK